MDNPIHKPSNVYESVKANRCIICNRIYILNEKPPNRMVNLYCPECRIEKVGKQKKNNCLCVIS